MASNLNCSFSSHMLWELNKVSLVWSDNSNNPYPLIVLVVYLLFVAMPYHEALMLQGTFCALPQTTSPFALKWCMVFLSVLNKKINNTHSDMCLFNTNLRIVGRATNLRSIFFSWINLLIHLDTPWRRSSNINWHPIPTRKYRVRLALILKFQITISFTSFSNSTIHSKIYTQ